MKNKIAVAVLSLAAFGAFCASAQTPAQAPLPPFASDENCGPMAPGGAPECAPADGRGGRFGPGGEDERGMRERAMNNLPEELKARVDALRAERQSLRALWIQAVVNRGEKPVETLRADFARDNAAAIAKLQADEKALREDALAIREGFENDAPGDAHRPHFGRGEPGNGPGPLPGSVGELAGPPDGTVRAAIESDIVARITALKEPLTVETYSKIVREVLASHRRDIVEAMRDGPGPGMGPMAPDLARMRDAMTHMRDASWSEKRAFRSELRTAMKIQDPKAREEAVRRVLEKYSDAPDDPKDAPAKDAPAPEGGAK